MIAINVLGESMSTENAMQLMERLNNERTENALASICDDLSFSMYVEESIVETIRELETKKSKAVNGKSPAICDSNKPRIDFNFFVFLFLDERFEYARKLKLCMSALRSAGERLGRYSLAKRQAVQQEDFIAAKLRKEQMEMYKRSVFEQLQVNVLLEPNGLCTENDSVSNVYVQKPSLPSPPSLQDVAASLSNESAPFVSTIHSPKSVHCDTSVAEARSPKQSPQLNQIGLSPKRGSPNTSSLRRRNKSAPRTSYDDYDERAVPALRQ